MYHHQFGDPSQSIMSYSDLSLMGGSSSSNNNSDLDNLRHHFGLLDSAHAATSSSYGSLLQMQMIHPNKYSNFSEVVVPVDSSAFSADFANKGYMVTEELGYGAPPMMEMPPQLGNRKRKKRTNSTLKREVDHQFEGINGSNKNEKKRRERLSNKYKDLKALLPNSTKPDRATIIADSMDYINELLRTLNELNMLVDMRRRRREVGARKHETGTDVDIAGDMESSCLINNPSNNINNVKGNLLRSSWLQRRSKETNVDVRIVEDEVFIKLTQHRRIDCMLAVSRVLDELDLDLLHLSGGNMGDSHIFMINAKIHEGSSVYACAIAKKIIEAMKIKYPQSLVC